MNRSKSVFAAILTPWRWNWARLWCPVVIVYFVMYFLSGAPIKYVFYRTNAPAELRDVFHVVYAPLDWIEDVPGVRETYKFEMQSMIAVFGEF